MTKENNNIEKKVLKSTTKPPNPADDKLVIKIFKYMVATPFAIIGVITIYFYFFDYPWVIGKPFRYKHIDALESYGRSIVKHGANKCLEVKIHQKINFPKDISANSCMKSANLIRLSYNRKSTNIPSYGVTYRHKGYESVYRGYADNIICEIRITADSNNENKSCTKSTFYEKDNIKVGEAYLKKSIIKKVILQ